MTDITLGEETITTFRQALERVSAVAHAKLPADLHGNLERATALVLRRHVWMDEDGKHAQVLSSDGGAWYLVNGHCTCMGVAHAPQGLCKHRVAVMLYRRASELLATAGGSGAPAARAAALPEAPASVNARVMIAGHEVQLTLRDTDEERLLVRLSALLARYPAAPCAQRQNAASLPAQTSGETPICGTHGPMKESSKAPGTWFCSKKLFNGSYCTEKWPAHR